MSAKAELESGTVVRADGLSITLDKVHKARANTTVYEATAGGRKVALKIVHGPIGRDARFRDAFKAELGRVAKIRSERAIRLTAFGVDEALDAPFVASEWIAGEDALAKVTRLGPMPAWSASSILEQLADALASAHEAGVVHRDLTADALWLVPAPPPATEPALRVSFAGVAKIASEVKKNTLAPMDRPLWMAPEQTETDVPITPATDVFTFGLLTYWLLVGKTFWLSPEADVMSLLREMTYGSIAKPSERAQQQGLARRVPHGFDAWFAKTVTKRPRDRFQSVREAFHALTPFIRQAIDVQRNEAIAAASKPRPASAPATSPAPAAPAPAAPAAGLEASRAEPVASLAAALAPAPIALAPTPAPIAPTPSPSPAKEISRTIAATPLSVRDPAPAPVTVAATPISARDPLPAPVAVAEAPRPAEIATTLVSTAPIADPKGDVPAPKRVEEAVVVPVKANNDTLIGAPRIDDPLASAANTLIGYAQPATPVDGTLTDPPAPNEDAKRDEPKKEEPARVEYAGALARFATPAPPPTASTPGAPPPPGLPPPPSPMDQPIIARPRETAQTKAERRRLMIIGASILGVILVFGAVGATLTYALVDKDDRRRDREEKEEKSAKKKKRAASGGAWSDASSPVPVTSEDPMWGDRDAAVTIVDFVDYESISSRALERALAEARRRYKPSQLRIVWKNAPEAQHGDGLRAALTSQAVFVVGGNEAFLRFHDDAAANTGSLNELSIETWGITSGVKRDALRKAIDAPETGRKVRADLDVARKLGESEAGVLFINGLRYELETSTRLFKKIDDALMEASVETDGGTAPEDVYVTLSKRNFKKRAQPRVPDIDLEPL